MIRAGAKLLDKKNAVAPAPNRDNIMTLTAKTLCLAALLALPLAVHADPWKDESGHGKWRGHHHGGDYKEEYWDGNCKVERKFKGNGDYKEERKCKGPRYGYYGPAPVYVQPAPVYVEPAPVHVPPGVTVHGTVTFPR